MADPLRHNFPCLSIAGLVTFGRCLNCDTRSCYIQAWKEHLHVGLIIDAERCPQCKALREALLSAREATYADIHAPAKARPIVDTAAIDAQCAAFNDGPGSGG